ncbi:hypothetical protein Bbelb_109050 [Branchiostoma belcheri]|nr:hypothetical protein Bbelb_109050 [Branchiostoma belcheri]
MATNSPTRTSAHQVGDYTLTRLCARDSEDDMEMCALLDRAEKDYHYSNYVRDGSVRPGREENYVHPLLNDSADEGEMCNVLGQTESAYNTFDETYFSFEDSMRLGDGTVPFAAPVQTSTPVQDNTASNAPETISISSDGESYDFLHLFGSPPDKSMELPSGYELLYRTPSIRSDSFTELDLLSGSFPSSTDPSEDGANDDFIDIVISPSSSNHCGEDGNKFSDISDVANLSSDSP